MKVCIVTSCGGHLTEVRCLRSIYQEYSHFYVIDDQVSLPEDMRSRTYIVSHSERDWKFLANLWQAYVILRKEKPTILLSTGAGLIVPFAIVAKVLCRLPVIYVETIARVTKPSLTGRIMYYLADQFFFQHPGLRKWFPKGRCEGTLI